jgi:hypothetical protein
MSEHVKGIEDVLAAIGRISDAARQGGALDVGLFAGAELGATYASDIAPHRSGSLGRAQRAIRVGNAVAIGIDPSVTNPTGRHPAVYGPIVAKRVRDFYAMVVDDRGDAIVDRAFQQFVKAAGK